jgi:hypothetical protein
MLGHDAERITMEYESQSFRHATLGPAVVEMRFAKTGSCCKSDEESAERQVFGMGRASISNDDLRL